MHSPNTGHAQLPNGAIVEIYFSRTFCSSTHKVFRKGGFYCKNIMILVRSNTKDKSALNLSHYCLNIFIYFYLFIDRNREVFVCVNAYGGGGGLEIGPNDDNKIQ